ncbi:MAG: MarR family transcriptional regulator [Anaerolineae bacterium]|nr:MarR family transcriptional regulator [Anaerolineae bacterium]
MDHFSLEVDYQRITERQLDILNFIEEYRQQKGYSPSIREIGAGTGIASTSAVNYQINRLVEAGYLVRTSEVSRSFILLEAAYEAMDKQSPNECESSNLRAEVIALRAENKRIREQYEVRVKSLERERNQLSQTVAMLKYRVIEQLEGVFS